MAKKTKKPQSKSTQRPCPVFSKDQHLGSSHNVFIMADSTGFVWRFDIDTGEARPVAFKA